MCTEETVYCCPKRQTFSTNLCETSLKDFLSKITILPNFPYHPNSTERSTSAFNETTTLKNKQKFRKRPNYKNLITSTEFPINHNLNSKANAEKFAFPEDSESILTEFEISNNLQLKQKAISEPSITNDPLIKQENHEIQNFIVSYNSTESKNNTKPSPNEFNINNESQILKNTTKAVLLLKIDELKNLNQKYPNISNNETANEFSNDHNSSIDHSNSFQSNETTGIPKTIENSTTSTQSSITTKLSISTESTTSTINDTEVTSSSVNTTTVRPRRKSEEKCDEYGMSTVHTIRVMALLGHKPREVTIDKCKHKAIPLVVGGREAMPYEFPHQALLGYEYNDMILWKCGGSLVSKNYILTAAHCVIDYDLGSVKVVKLGMFKQLEDTAYTITRRVIGYREHPDYDRINRIDDIGLLKLDDFVPLSEYINPICLPNKQSEHRNAIAIGFGATETSARSKRLMKVVLEKFQPYSPSRISNETIVDKFLFFGHRTQRRDTCSGDSGSPLQVSNDKNVKCSYTQIGIVSYGPNECGIPGLPAVYVNVFYYIDWIEQFIWEDEDRLAEQS
ncbi:hypothetical protein ACKWTF_001053 [Chironomus riparius]